MFLGRFKNLARARRHSKVDLNVIEKSELMDRAWYLQAYPELKDSEEDPAHHYVRIGSAEGKNPGPNFDTIFYLNTYPDVKRAGVNPLAHYLRSGASEGRKPFADGFAAYSVSDARLDCIKAFSSAPKVALFVTHAPLGRIKSHVKHHVRSLIKLDIAVILIVASDVEFVDHDSDIIPDLSGLYIRDNVGFDFAAWAHLFVEIPQLYQSETIYLTNDSIVGPLNDELMEHVVKSIEESSADFVGLSDNYEMKWHVQSFFVAFKSSAISSDIFRSFWNEVVSYAQKTSVIEAYEVGMTQRFVEAGLKCEVLFPERSGRPLNRTIVEWRELITEGFPFIKVTTIRDEHAGVDISDWRALVEACGLDPAIPDQAVLDSKASAPKVSLRARSGTPIRTVRRRTSGAQDVFSPKFYLAVYGDVAAAGVDPLKHYLDNGFAEGRIGSVPGMSALRQFAVADPDRETVLIVSHEGGRSGCPILSHNLIQGLIQDYNVIALFLAPGPIMEACRELGAAIVGPVTLAHAPKIADVVIDQIVDAVPIRFAVTNSIEARYVLPALARRYVPTVSLIHEFTAYIRPRDAFRDAVRWATSTVFSAPVTRDDALRAYPDLGWRDYPIIPQGRCIVPDPRELKFSPFSTDADVSRVKKLLRPAFPGEDDFVILGTGQVEVRKGVDIFIDCAAKVVALAPDLKCRFFWMGRGFDALGDVSYSVYIADQIRRSGLEGRVFFLGEVAAPQAAYETADALLLTSRLDPLPNAAIEALDTGLPVVCFDKTTGIADVLTANGLGPELVAPYLDVDDMARKVIALARSKPLHERISAQAAALARATFNMPAYVSSLKELGEQGVELARQEQSDAETIAEHASISLAYHLQPEAQKRDVAAIARDYVRSWASGVGMRKLAPGFHPGIYLERHGVTDGRGDPLADYLRAGRPEGPWNFALITPDEAPKPLPAQLRVGLHIHAYYPAILPEMLSRLMGNQVRPDLWISVGDEDGERAVRRFTRTYPGQVTIRITPNRGRDIGPFLTEFGAELCENYDIIGHLHTKRTADLANPAVGQRWYRFLLENLVGGEAPMADIVLGRMAQEPDLGLVFPDDPHVIGWDDNLRFVEPYLRALSINDPPRHMNFPVGTMFWARPQAIKGLFDLGLKWGDYPPEPLPYDGSLLHGLERLFGVVAERSGYKLANTNCPDLTR
jgi:lipopolysaccharide biosynthesis protein/glycosyltransferase involved in cell wall biosynthesis